MQNFVQRFASHVSGVLSGFDRLRLRGTKRLCASLRGMSQYLWQRRIPLKDFTAFAQQTTATLRQGIEQQAQQLQRPLLYLSSSRPSKEQLALDIARRDGITAGLIGVFSCVEPCYSFSVHPDRASKKLVLRLGPKKCLHYYHYFLDEQFGLLHARLQSWFPFTLLICLNGREWLARQMDQAGIGYVRRDNCFVQVEDLEAAQRLLDSQLQLCWPQALERLAALSFPGHEQLFADCPVPYYWSAEESEWATDVLFRSPQALAALLPRLVRHGLEVLHSADVLRFLGQRGVTAAGQVHGNFAGEVATDLKRRLEVVRVKHRLQPNWIKMYDKQGSVLRVETVINDASDLKVYRAKEGDADGDQAWRRLRKGVADLARRAQVSQQANERYLESLATVQEPRTLGELTAALGEPVPWHGGRARALHVLSAGDNRLLRAVGRGEFLVNGFRNRDVRPLLHGAAADAARRRRQSAAVTRQLRLLRAHGLIQKVPKTHRYQLTALGRAVLTAVLSAQQADVAKLTQAS
jgi:hypothetical protein